MKLPFFEHRGTGVHITDRAIRWVELSRIGRHIRIVCAEFEEIRHGDIQAGLEKLAERVQPSFPFVAMNIGPSAVNRIVLEVPFFDDEENLAIWLNDTALEQIPEGSDPEEFMTSYQLFGDPDEGEQCLFVTAGKQVVEERTGLAESAGLHPVILTTGEPEAGYSLMFDEDFTTGDSWLLKAFEDDCCLIQYSDGLIEQIFHLPEHYADTEAVLAEAGSLIASQPGGNSGRLYVADSRFMDRVSQKTEHNTVYENLQLIRPNPLSHLSHEKEILSRDFTIASGMALKMLYPPLEGINLLEENKVKVNREAIKKQDLSLTAKILGGIFVVSFSLLMLFQWYLGNRVDEAEVQAALMEEKITAISDAQNRIRDLQTHVTTGRKLVGERTATARVLETAGRALPRGVWFHELKLILEGSTETNLILFGFAWNEALVAELLERFEKQNGINRVRLVYSEQVQTRDFYGHAPYRQRQLVRFEVRINLDQKRIQP